MCIRKRDFVGYLGTVRARVSGPIGQDLLLIAWPSLVELLLGSLFGMVNMMMLGRIANQAEAAASVAAVGLTNQPLFIGLSLVQSLNIGATALVARYYGSGRKTEMQVVLKHVFVLNLCCFVVPISIFCMIFAESIMVQLGGSPDAVAIGGTYFRLLMVGFVAQSVVMTLSAALRGIGETKVPMRNNLLANFLNALLNAVLVYGLFGLPQLGVVGAGIATMVANFVAAGLVCRYLLSGHSRLLFSLRAPFRFQKTLFRQLVTLGVPTALEQLALRVGIMLFMGIVAGLGTESFAAHQIAANILSLSINPGQAFSIAAASLVGQSLGARDVQKAEAYGRMASRMGAVFALVMAVVFYFGASAIAGLYSQNPRIIEAVVIALRIVGLVQPFQVNQLVLAGALRGAGDTKWPLFSTLLGVLVVRVLLAHVFVTQFGWGIAGAWYAAFCDQIVRWFMMLVHFKRGKWKLIELK